MRPPGCVDWPYGLTEQGYARLGAGRSRLVSHAILRRVVGPRPAGQEAAHSCGRPVCVNPEHLRWDTHKGNVADKIIHGTENRGERNGHSKLTAGDVRMIRARLGLGETQVSVAEAFGVTNSTISAIARRQRWAWLV